MSALHPPVPPATLDLAARLYGVTADRLTDLGGFENHVFAFDAPQGPRVLRLSPATHRTARQVSAELDFLRFLHERDLSVCAPVPSQDGAWLTVVGDGYVTAAFERASGERVRADGLTDGTLRAWGRLLGELHEAAQAYTPADPGGRYVWHADPHVAGRAAHTALVGADVMARHDEVVDRLKRVPASPEVFGLVHNDAHPGNFLVHEGRITLFDFDDCTYNFLANDLAMALFYLLWGAQGDREALAARALPALLAGYREVRELTEAQLALIPDLLRLREVLLEVLLARVFPEASRSPEQREAGRLRRERVLRGEPIVNLDFRAFMLTGA